MAKDRQSSWAAGELTPDLHGQSGSPAYRAGAALIENFLVTPQGTLINRSGSVCLALLGPQTARLEPFLFGGDDPRLIELFGATGEFAVRTPDGEMIVGDDTSGEVILGTIAETLAALRSIRVAQCAGTMMLARSNALVDIRRVDDTDYVEAAVAFSPPDFGSSAAPFSSANNKRNPAVQTSATGITINVLTGDADHPVREWDYAITRVVAIDDGNPDKPDQVLETSPRALAITTSGNVINRSPGRITFTVDSAGVYTANMPVEFAVYGDWEQRIDVGGAAGDPWREFNGTGRTGNIVAHRVYRGRGGVFGYIGETTTRNFVDDGRDPDIANPPPVGSNPYGTASYIPVAVAFANDRRLMANIAGLPQRAWGSAVGNWSDFDPVITPDDADALSFDLAANKHQAIRHLLASSVVFAFSEVKTWAITGSGDLEVLTPTSIAARPAAPVGVAHYPAPIETDDAILFIESKGRRPYAMTPDGNGQVQLTDLSVLSSHLFEHHTIVSWAWARDPHPTLWAVRDDGILLSLAYTAGSQVQAWARHEIAGGYPVEAVAVLPIDQEDLLYMVVNRGSTRGLCLDRLAPRIVSDVRYQCHLDCATIEDGTKDFSAAIGAVTGSGPYTVGIDKGTSSGLTVNTIVMFHDVNNRLVRGHVTAANAGSCTVTLDDFTALADVQGHTAAAGTWGIGSDSVSSTGLPVSDPVDLTAVIDGVVYPGLSDTGTVNLPAYGLVRIVGRPFTSRFQSLAIDQERGKQKIVSHVRVETIGNGGAFGADFDNLQDIPPREVADGYDIVEREALATEMAVAARHDKTAVVVVEQSEPKPFKILAVEREYVLGG